MEFWFFNIKIGDFNTAILFDDFAYQMAVALDSSRLKITYLTFLSSKNGGQMWLSVKKSIKIRRRIETKSGNSALKSQHPKSRPNLLIFLGLFVKC